MNRAIRVALAVQPEAVPAWAADLRCRLAAVRDVDVGWLAVAGGARIRVPWCDALDARLMGLRRSTRGTVALSALDPGPAPRPERPLDLAIACGVHPAMILVPRVWALDHAIPGSVDPIDGDVLGAADVTLTVVRRWCDGQPRRVLYAENSQVDPRSPARGAAHRDAKAIDALVRLVERLRTSGDDDWLPHQDDALAGATAIGRAPSLLDKSRHLGRFVRDRWRQRTTILQWQLVWQVNEAELPMPTRWRHVAPAPDRFWADPVLAERDGRTWIFFEEANLCDGKGRILVAPIDARGIGEPIVALSERFHLSYPHVFVHDGTWYMLPEMSDAARVGLYRCVQWPDRWEADAVLMDGIRACDATLLREGGRWWLFAAVRVEGARLTEGLYLFSSEDLRGPWRPHPENPVRRDVRWARPAGAILRDTDGGLLRPAQDGGARYGRAWSLWRIEELSGTRYRERFVAAFEPGWLPNVVATHAYGRVGRLHVSDAQVRLHRDIPRPS